MRVIRGIYHVFRFILRRFWWLVFLAAMLALNWATLTRPGADLAASRVMAGFGAGPTLHQRGLVEAQAAAAANAAATAALAQDLAAARAEVADLRAALAAETRARADVAARTAAVAERIEARQVAAALRQRAALPAAAVPGAGFAVSWHLAARALEEACETLADLAPLAGQPAPGAECSAGLPPEDDLRQEASRNSRAAWAAAVAVLPDLPDLPEPVQTRVPEGVRLIPAPGTPPRQAD
jgi:hypothetical protein